MYGFGMLVVMLGLSACFEERHSREGLMNFFFKKELYTGYFIHMLAVIY